MNNLKKIRIEKGLSQQDFAGLLHISKEQYIDIEENPLCATPTTMEKISLILGVSLDYIFLPYILQNVDNKKVG